MSTTHAEPESRRPAPLAIRLLPAVLAVGLVALGVWVVGGERLALPQLGGVSSSPRVGAIAPDFALSGMDGQMVRLSDLRGKRVVVNFWATWCPPCRAEMPDLDRVARDLRDQGVVVLAVDQMESQERVASFLSETGLGPSPSLVPALDLDGTVAQEYRVNALPSTFVVDASGVIRDVTLGPIAESTLRAKLERAR